MKPVPLLRYCNGETIKIILFQASYICNNPYEVIPIEITRAESSEFSDYLLL